MKCELMKISLVNRDYKIVNRTFRHVQCGDYTVHNRIPCLRQQCNNMRGLCRVVFSEIVVFAPQLTLTTGDHDDMHAESR